MNIAVVDIAAVSGGALSVLEDFLDYIGHSKRAKEHIWYIFTGIKLNINYDHILNIYCPNVKKSWLYRLEWDNIQAKKIFKKYKIDLIFSLQNTGFKNISIPQYIYFHNVLLLQDKHKYSFLSFTKKYAIYTRFIAPYTFFTMNFAKAVIVQTETVKKELESRIKKPKIISIRPNVKIPEKLLKNDIGKHKLRGFIYPAAAVPFKDFELIIQCVKKYENWFLEKNVEIIFTIDGTENDYAASIMNLSKGIHPIKLIGYQSRENILRYYFEYGLLINSSIESFPLPFIEAASFGTCIVAADFPYAVEILENIDEAVCYKQNNVDDMFEKIELAYGKPIGSKNRKFSNVNTWEYVLKILIDN